MKGRLEHKVNIENRINTKLEDMPVFMSNFYNSLEKKEIKTTEVYLSYVYNFLLFLFDKNINSITTNQLAKIKSGDINRYMRSIQTKSKNGDVVTTSGSYRATVWTAINRFFIFLIKEEIIQKNPCENTERPQVKDKVQNRVSMDQRELRVFLNTVLDGAGNKRARARQEKWRSRDALIILLFIHTGMRTTALDEINIDDIDLEKRQLIVTDKREDNYIYSLHESIIPYLKEWLQEREELLNGTKCDALFISNRRTRMTTKAISNLVDKYSIHIDKHITPQKFRASYASIFYEATGDIHKVQRSMRHNDPATTQRYIIDNEDYKDEATNIMANILNPSKKRKVILNTD